jgi:hypothetical protein
MQLKDLIMQWEFLNSPKEITHQYMYLGTVYSFEGFRITQMYQSDNKIANV